MKITIDSITFETECFVDMDFDEFKRQFSGKFYKTNIIDAFQMVKSGNVQKLDVSEISENEKPKSEKKKLSIIKKK